MCHTIATGLLRMAKCLRVPSPIIIIHYILSTRPRVAQRSRDLLRLQLSSVNILDRKANNEAVWRDFDD